MTPSQSDSPRATPTGAARTPTRPHAPRLEARIRPY